MRCQWCRKIVFDQREESGAMCADWATADGDFGCDLSPETCIILGVGPHEPQDYKGL